MNLVNGLSSCFSLGAQKMVELEPFVGIFVYGGVGLCLGTGFAMSTAQKLTQKAIKNINSRTEAGVHAQAAETVKEIVLPTLGVIKNTFKSLKQASFRASVFLGGLASVYTFIHGLSDGCISSLSIPERANSHRAFTDRKALSPQRDI